MMNCVLDIVLYIFVICFHLLTTLNLNLATIRNIRTLQFSKSSVPILIKLLPYISSTLDSVNCLTFSTNILH